MNDFLLTLPASWLYSACVNAKNIDWVWKPKERRTVPPSCGFFVSEKRCPYVMGGLFWEGFGLPTFLGISTPITTPPARVSHGMAVFSKPLNKGA